MDDRHLKIAGFRMQDYSSPIAGLSRQLQGRKRNQKALDFLNDTAIRNETMQAAERFCSWLDQGMDEGLIKAFPFID